MVHRDGEVEVPVVHEQLPVERSESLRPKSARLEEGTDRYGRAAAADRVDALGVQAVLDLQRSAGNTAVASLLADEEPSPVHEVISTGGRPLEPEVRADMEARLGHDFADVRVHDDAAASASAAAVHANAYTVGSNVVFQRDRYDPSTAEGKITLAHELTHVVQQRTGPVDGTPAGGGIRVSDPGDPFERAAAATAERVMAAPEPAPSVQRDEFDEEEEPLQGAFVQRQTDEEQDEDELPPA